MSKIIGGKRDNKRQSEGFVMCFIGESNIHH